MSKQIAKKFNTDLLLKIFLVVAVLLAGVKLLLSNENGQASLELSDKQKFAICLMEKGVIMYGVDTCEYCQIQKKMFGSSFEKINYINCDFEQEICQAKAITKYPVWEISGKQSLGIQTFDQLGSATGCVVPK
jgi:thioredoxin-related protein